MKRDQRPDPPSISTCKYRLFIQTKHELDEAKGNNQTLLEQYTTCKSENEALTSEIEQLQSTIEKQSQEIEEKNRLLASQNNQDRSQLDEEQLQSSQNLSKLVEDNPTQGETTQPIISDDDQSSGQMSEDSEIGKLHLH